MSELTILHGDCRDLLPGVAEYLKLIHRRCAGVTPGLRL